LSSGSRLAAVAGAAVIALGAAVPWVPHDPLRRLVNVESDGRDPQWDRDVDGRALRSAGAELPDDATYALVTRPDDPVLSGNLKAGTQLFLAPALPVRSPRRAGWLVLGDGGRVVLRRR